MKKFFLMLLILHVITNIHAQQKQKINPQQIKPPVIISWIGIDAGPNFNSIRYYDKITTIEGSNTNFHAGIFYRRIINKYFVIQPELKFSIRGGVIHDVDSTINARLMNIELPINFLYVYKNLRLGLGPEIDYGISGKFISNGRKRDAYNKKESFERTLKRFEAGANFMIAYQFKKGIFISLNYSPGITNIYKGDGSAPNNVHAKTSVVGISLGYLFGITKDE
jgi:hypothetical protein